MTEIQLSKLEAAKRQIETAITLFIKNKDAVAIHTLTAASHEILRDLSKKQGKESFVKDGLLKKVRPEFQKRFIIKINEAENFFKHADKDSDKFLEFDAEQTEFLLWDCCWMFQNITNEYSPLILLYRTWFFTKNPDYFEEEKDRTAMKKAISNLDLNYGDRENFFKKMSQLFIQLEEQKILTKST